MSTEGSFHEAMLSIYQSVGKATGYWANYYLRAVRKHGGLSYAKQALATKSDVQDGFLKLIEVGKPELSMEALVIKKEFQSLFAKNEIDEAQRRLDTIPDYAWRKKVEPENNFSGEITNEEIFTEGATQQVTVNIHERNNTARQACLDKHGYGCKVCSMNFEEVYGEIGKGFIHVHHIKPLAGIRAQYEINPTKDLVPVCPNCHAMLHSSEPPLTVDELKGIMGVK